MKKTTAAPLSEEAKASSNTLAEAIDLTAGDDDNIKLATPLPTALSGEKDDSAENASAETAFPSSASDKENELAKQDHALTAPSQQPYPPSGASPSLSHDQ